MARTRILTPCRGAPEAAPAAARFGARLRASHGLPRGRRRHLRGGRGQGPHQGAWREATFNASVLTEIGSFGGMFRPDLSRYREPVLVASTDGVGHEDQGGDRSPASTTPSATTSSPTASNDILVQGAMPLFFLDYVALGRMDPVKVEQIVSGFSRACAEFGCPLIGGETAEMPGTYAEDDYDLAGFIVGVVERDKALPRGVREGDVLLGLPSPGLHTNGYSLARKVLLETLGHRVDTHLPELGTTVGAGAPRAAPQLPRRPRAAPRARQGPGARPHHRRRLPRQHPARPARGPRGAPAPGLLGGAAALPPHPEGRGRLRRGDGRAPSTWASA